ncbi:MULTISPECIES: hypothetical protein [Hymenobacter]|uniref:hypothetical protein n=1 Tax=Hymenobacter TaxID=89966 RepID=UPI001058E12E|nr:MULTISPECIES: hypothetical protein [Hymenobacter]QIL78172.1 hypothetical protein G7064_20295 [Hymenobacter sp. HDW8]
MNQHLYLFLESFLNKHSKKQWLDQVNRAKPSDNLLRGMDALPREFDERYCVKLAKGSKQQDIAFVNQALARYKLTTCYVLSAYAPLHEQTMTISEALDTIVGDSSTTLISFIAGKVAYFEGHSPGDRYLCIREV